MFLAPQKPQVENEEGLNKPSSSASSVPPLSVVSPRGLAEEVEGGKTATSDPGQNKLRRMVVEEEESFSAMEKVGRDGKGGLVSPSSSSLDTNVVMEDASPPARKRSRVNSGDGGGEGRVCGCNCGGFLEGGEGSSAPFVSSDGAELKKDNGTKKKGEETPNLSVSEKNGLNPNVPAKSQQSPKPSNNPKSETEALPILCLTQKWSLSEHRVQTHPHEAFWGATSTARLPIIHNSNGNGNSSQNMSSLSKGSTPLALACRYGAPCSTIQALLAANTQAVRNCIPSRGTPLHEACSNSNVGKEALCALLDADEKLEEAGNNEGGKRAVLMQDVDGCVPLHLLVRRALNELDGSRGDFFGDGGRGSEVMAIMEALVQSCPEAVGVPDLMEYEETPLILALKGEVYAGGDGGDSSFPPIPPHETENIHESFSDYDSILERRIHCMVQLMVTSYPASVRLVFSPGYTPIHSALFHGRCSETLGLLLQADQTHRHHDAHQDHCYSEQEQQDSDKVVLHAALKSNRTDELPLHFAAMRGESARTVDLLGGAAPRAVLARDCNGLTPVHWLWIRLVDSIAEKYGHLLRADKDEGSDEIVEDQASGALSAKGQLQHIFTLSPPPSSSQASFDFTYFLQTRTIDPPVDFFRMRHIPAEYLYLQDSCQRRVAAVIGRLMKRPGEGSVDHRWWCAEGFFRRLSKQLEKGYDGGREELIMVLFWGKVIGLLRAAWFTMMDEKKPAGKSSTFVNDAPSRNGFLSQALTASAKKQVKPHSRRNSPPSGGGRMNQTGHKYSRHPTANKDDQLENTRTHMLHVACTAPCVPLSIVKLCVSLYGKDPLSCQDFLGRLPLHYAARRLWSPKEITQNMKLLTSVGDEEKGEVTHSKAASSSDVPIATRVIEGESLRTLAFILTISPPSAIRTYDTHRRLPLHHAIVTAKTILKQYSLSDANGGALVAALFQMLDLLIKAHPDSLERRDGVTGLFPFMMAAYNEEEGRNVIASEDGKNDYDIGALTVTFQLVRLNPPLVGVGIPRSDQGGKGWV